MTPAADQDFGGYGTGELRPVSRDGGEAEPFAGRVLDGTHGDIFPLPVPLLEEKPRSTLSRKVLRRIHKRRADAQNLIDVVESLNRCVLGPGALGVGGLPSEPQKAVLHSLGSQIGSRLKDCPAANRMRPFRRFSSWTRLTVTPAHPWRSLDQRWCPCPRDNMEVPPSRPCWRESQRRMRCPSRG